MKKVLLVSHSQMLGGAERCLIELADGLKRKGYDVVVTLPSYGDNYLYFKNNAIRVIISSYGWWVSTYSISFFKKIRDVLSLIYSTVKFVRILIKEKPDVVLNNTITIPSAPLACRILRIRIVWFIHEFGDKDHGFKFHFGLKKSYWFVDRLSDTILVNSKYLYDNVLEYCPKDKVQIINYSISVNNDVHIKDINKNKESIHLFMIGQIQEGKGQMDILIAYKQLLFKFPNLKLTFIGSQSDKLYLRELLLYIEKYNLPNITFQKFDNNPFKFLSDFPIGIVSSRFEAFGRITIEYMKLRVPVIGFNAPNTNNLIRDGWNGFLYNPTYPKLEDVVSNVATLDIKSLNVIINNAFNFAMTEFNSERYVIDVIKVL